MKITCPHCQGHIAYDLAEGGQQGNCPHCDNIINLPAPPSDNVILPIRKHPATLSQKLSHPNYKAALQSLGCGLLAAFFAFGLMPSAGEVAENRAKVEALEKWNSEYHSMSATGREVTDALMKEGNASTKTMDNALSAALEKPQSRITAGVFFWGLAAICFLGYSIRSFRKPI